MLGSGPRGRKFKSSRPDSFGFDLLRLRRSSEGRPNRRQCDGRYQLLALKPPDEAQLPPRVAGSPRQVEEFRRGKRHHLVQRSLRYGRPCASIAAPEACTKGDESVTGRSFFTMLLFAGMIGAVMWFFILPALTPYRPSLP